MSETADVDYEEFIRSHPETLDRLADSDRDSAWVYEAYRQELQEEGEDES